MTDFDIDVLRLGAIATPAAISGTTKLYGKDVLGITQVHGLSGAGVETQMTPPAFLSADFAAEDYYLALGPGPTSYLNQSASQTIFPSGRSALTTLPVGQYRFRASFFFLATPNTVTSHQLLLSFNTGTATVTGSYRTYALTQAGIVTTAQVAIVSDIQSLAPTAYSPATTTGAQRWIDIEGFITCTVAGSFIPAISCSATPGWTTCTLNAGSYLELRLLGSAPFTNKGWT